MSLTQRDNRVFPIMTKLAGCLCSKLTDFGFDTCFCGVVTGDATDLTPVSEDGDMGWVRLVGLTPAQEEIAGQLCAVRLVANFEVGVASCYPIREEALSVDEQLHISDVAMAGMQAALQAILCCDWTPNGRSMILGEFIPLGPEGGVIGGAWNVSVEV